MAILDQLLAELSTKDRTSYQQAIEAACVKALDISVQHERSPKRKETKNYFARVERNARSLARDLRDTDYLMFTARDVDAFACMGVEDLTRRLEALADISSYRQKSIASGGGQGRLWTDIGLPQPRDFVATVSVMLLKLLLNTDFVGSNNRHAHALCEQIWAQMQTSNVGKTIRRGEATGVFDWTENIENAKENIVLGKSMDCSGTRWAPLPYPAEQPEGHPTLKDTVRWNCWWIADAIVAPLAVSLTSPGRGGGVNR